MNIKINNKIRHENITEVLEHVYKVIRSCKDIDDIGSSHGVFESCYPFKHPIFVTSKRTKQTLTINIEKHQPLI